MPADVLEAVATALAASGNQDAVATAIAYAGKETRGLSGQALCTAAIGRQPSR
ncbi:hypothetical protein ACFC09_19035 [Streptomyces sp. NPDC056161]|uniref:hypothetical protein n=1 Tax=Streptomyces sp. NPDC056161 TaxID=3345732 RepID=UPI0035DFD5BD